MTTPALAASIAACLLVARAPWAWARSFARLSALRRGTPSAAGGSGGPGGPRWSPRKLDAVVRLDVIDLLDLLDAAIAAGASLPKALGAVGDAAGGDDGRVLERAASALVMGADWQAAWRGSPARLAPVVDGLAPTWVTGAAPGPALRATAERMRRERQIAAREAAGRLGVHLVLPLGLCFLPAFVLIGLVPVMVSLGASLLDGTLPV